MESSNALDSSLNLTLHCTSNYFKLSLILLLKSFSRPSNTVLSFLVLQKFFSRIKVRTTWRNTLTETFSFLVLLISQVRMYLKLSASSKLIIVLAMHSPSLERSYKFQIELIWVFSTRFNISLTVVVWSLTIILRSSSKSMQTFCLPIQGFEFNVCWGWEF